MLRRPLNWSNRLAWKENDAAVEDRGAGGRGRGRWCRRRARRLPGRPVGGPDRGDRLDRWSADQPGGAAGRAPVDRAVRCDEVLPWSAAGDPGLLPTLVPAAEPGERARRPEPGCRLRVPALPRAEGRAGGSRGDDRAVSIGGLAHRAAGHRAGVGGGGSRPGHGGDVPQHARSRHRHHRGGRNGPRRHRERRPAADDRLRVGDRGRSAARARRAERADRGRPDRHPGLHVLLRGRPPPRRAARDRPAGRLRLLARVPPGLLARPAARLLGAGATHAAGGRANLLTRNRRRPARRHGRPEPGGSRPRTVALPPDPGHAVCSAPARSAPTSCWSTGR